MNQSIADLDLRTLLAAYPQIERNILRLITSNYDEFVESIYVDLDTALQEISNNPKERMDDKEDRLTLEIVSCLKMQGYNAEHDTKIGGHVDILIKKGNYTWIAEAKIHRGNAWLLEGFNQLIHRYTPGNSNSNRGAMIIYIKSANAKSIMDNWKNHLLSEAANDDSNYSDLSTEQCHLNNLAFYTKCQHPRSGQDFITRHIPVSIYHAPID